MSSKDSLGFLLRSGAATAPDASETTADFGELDVVKIITDAYAGDGLARGERGTVVLVHNAGGKTAYEVEFDNWETKFPVKVKTLAGNEIELVKRWRG